MDSNINTNVDNSNIISTVFILRQFHFLGNALKSYARAAQFKYRYTGANQLRIQNNHKQMHLHLLFSIIHILLTGNPNVTLWSLKGLIKPERKIISSDGVHLKSQPNSWDAQILSGDSPGCCQCCAWAKQVRTL